MKNSVICIIYLLRVTAAERFTHMAVHGHKASYTILLDIFLLLFLYAALALARQVQLIEWEALKK